MVARRNFGPAWSGAIYAGGSRGERGAAPCRRILRVRRARAPRRSRKAPRRKEIRRNGRTTVVELCRRLPPAVYTPPRISPRPQIVPEAASLASTYLLKPLNYAAASGPEVRVESGGSDFVVVGGEIFGKTVRVGDHLEVDISLASGGGLCRA